jgi:hypothetical protein
MIIIGVDFHPEFQQIALMDSDSGEFQEKRLVLTGLRSSQHPARETLISPTIEQPCIWR